MAWIRGQCIFQPTAQYPWSQSHAQVPSVLVLPDCLRIYYATRDSQGRSLTSFVDVDRTDPGKIIYVHDQPVLSLGKPGTHDEDGVMVGSVVAHGNKILLYYTGWRRCVNVPYAVSIGLAESQDGGITFQRIFDGPVVDRTVHEPYMTMSPYVLFDQGQWHMWYGSGTGWVDVNGTFEPLYVIKYAHSTDGQRWHQPNITCIPAEHSLEANTRPSVMKSEQGYEMWFSYRHTHDFREGSGAYRLGYARSQDGLNWEKIPFDFDVAPHETAWDAQMMAYPAVVEVQGQRLLFYNGNGFGRSGFGFARWIDDNASYQQGAA